VFSLLLDTTYGTIFVCLVKYCNFRHLVSFPCKANFSVTVIFASLLRGYPEITDFFFWGGGAPCFANFSYSKGRMKTEIRTEYRWNYIEREKPKYSVKDPVFQIIFSTTNLAWHGL
jgi:hypothetical protein